MDRAQIRAEWDKFIEYPSDDKSFVSTVSAQLFAEHIAKLQATQEPLQAGELPDEREAFEQWWRQRQLLTFPKDYDQSRLADWGAAYKPAAKDAWQARAALSARSLWFTVI